MERTVSFPFHPWVRRACRRALVLGLGVVALLALVSWLLRDPRGETWGRAFGVLLAYSLLFWASLAKVWWTAGRPAVSLEPDALAYRSLLALRPRRVPYALILAAGPKPGTHSYRLVVERRGVARELFLNLAVLLGRRPFLTHLGQALEAAGLAPVPPHRDTWRRPDWQEPQPEQGPPSPRE